MAKTPTQPQSLFRNAITEADGVSVNVGYLWMFWLGWLDTSLSLFTVASGLAMQWFDPLHAYPFAGVAAALGAIWGTYSTALGALGLFLVGDRRPSPTA